MTITYHKLLTADVAETTASENTVYCSARDKEIKDREALKKILYIDTVGFASIGYGLNLKELPANRNAVCGGCAFGVAWVRG